MKNLITLVVSVFAVVFVSSMAYSADMSIDMLNKLGKEKMVYSVKVAKIDVNDKISWKHVSKGHNVEFIGMPKGVKKYKSKINKKAEFEFKIPGIYLYQCTPHKAMGMIGIVVVGGDKSNIEKIKKVKLYGKSKKIFKKLLKDL